MRKNKFNPDNYRDRYSVTDHRQKVKGYFDMLEGIWPIEVAVHSHINCKNLAHWFVHNLSKKYPVYDFGCGRGYYVHNLIEAGFTHVTGFEGTTDIHQIAYCNKSHIIIGDITLPMNCMKRGTVICLEVMEHIPVEQMDAAMNNLRAFCNDELILSWAIPGQGGIGHCNERDAAFVIPYLKKYGFVFMEEKTLTIREKAGQEIPYFANSIYAFRKVD